jgi:ABC-2 type transport system permease protein
MTEAVAIYVLWLREMKRFIRAKSRVVGTLAMPLFFMAFLALGFRRVELPNLPPEMTYLDYLVPGIIGMTLLFSSTFAGLSVLWDREFGFLKEIMVAPVRRVSIVLGRIAGGSTTSLIQGVMILVVSLLLGFAPASLWGALASVIFMVLIAVTFISIGLIFASNMHDIHGFNMVMNFLVFPLFLLSGALFPVENLPEWVRVLSYIDPLTYGVDGLRGTLSGFSFLPLGVDLVVLTLFSLVFIVMGAWFFERCEC